MIVEVALAAVVLAVTVLIGGQSVEEGIPHDRQAPSRHGAAYLTRRPRRRRHHWRAIDTADSPGAQLAASVVVPGAASMGRRPLVAVPLLLLGVALPIALGAWALGRRDDPVGLAVDPRFLGAVAAVGVASIVARLAAIGEVAYEFRDWPGIVPRSAAATIVTLALALPVLYVSSTANDTRRAVAVVFDEGEDEGPLFVPEQTEQTAQTPVDGSAPQGSPVIVAGAAGEAVDPGTITNILLLGGDAMPGRFGMNTDSMIIVSVNKANGRTALVSIPRDLVRLRFPSGSPLAERFPEGFDENGGQAHTVFVYMDEHPELTDYYSRSGFDPRAIALAEGIGYSLDVQIDDYALVNMQGFSDIIDAVGGVTLDLAERVSLPEALDDQRQLPEAVGPGRVEMDGAVAVAFVRSREDDSDDSQRMGRQRQLLAALGSQVSVRDAVSGLDDVAGALEDSLRTSMSGSEFAGLLDLLGDNSKIGESIGLVPPLVEPGRPDWELIREIIDAEQRFVSTGDPSGYAS